MREGEQRHRGEVRVVIEASLPVRDAWAGVTPRQRARTLFGLLEVWNTHEHVGVLLYLNLADHAVEILADRGIAARVEPHVWRGICETITQGFARRVAIGPVLEALEQIHAVLAAHFLPTARHAPTNSPTSRLCSDGARQSLPGRRSPFPA